MPNYLDRDPPCSAFLERQNKPVSLLVCMKPIGKIEESLSKTAEQTLGFKPSSKIKRGPIGIVISIIIVYFEMSKSEIF